MKIVLAIAVAGMLAAVLAGGTSKNGPADLLNEQRVTIDRQYALIRIQRSTISNQRRSLKIVGRIANALEFQAAMLAAEVEDCRAGIGEWEL